MTPHDHPDLTSHVLGELDAEHAEAMAQWIAENPTARLEAERIGDLAQHLRATASLPEVTLHPHQREAILSGPQLVRKMVEQAAQKQKQRTLWKPVLVGVGRVAAAAAFLIAGFMAGSRFKSQVTKTEVAKTEPAKAEQAKPAPAQKPFRATELPVVAVVEVTPSESASQSPVQSETKSPVPTTESPGVGVMAVQSPVALVATKATEKAVLPTMKVLSEPLISTTKSAVAQVSIQPLKTRSGPLRVAAGSTAATPIISRDKAPLATPTKKTELLIHSWKAEVAACPWDESRRLLRLSIQLPSEQPASLIDQAYPMQVTFQPSYVRSYRPLVERSVPAARADEAGLQVAWYEFVPNGAAADEAGKVIASVSLPNAKFTTTAMGPFDGTTQLQVVDRGLAWTEASDDFLFESSVAGFGLLMKGASTSPTLNHAVVLSLAERTIKGDRNGERARFVKLVQEAQKAAGL